MCSKLGGSQRCCRDRPSTCGCRRCREHRAAWAGASSTTRAAWHILDPWRWVAMSRLVALGEGMDRPQDLHPCSEGWPQQAAVPTAPFPPFPSLIYDSFALTPSCRSERCPGGCVGMDAATSRKRHGHECQSSDTPHCSQAPGQGWCAALVAC